MSNVRATVMTMIARWWLASSLVLIGCGDCSEDSGGLDAPTEQDVFDAGPQDFGPRDLGVRDAGRDGGSFDAIPVDSALFDAFVVDGGELDDSGVRGTCSSPADCQGRACLVVQDGPRGWHTCAVQLEAEATSCGDPSLDFCCSTADCFTNGTCRRGPLWYCGGAPPIEHNECIYDECQIDSDCGRLFGTCVPKGAFGEHANVCVLGGCHFDDECISRAGGRCVPFFNPCSHRHSGFQCVYADSPCDGDDDCTHLPGGYCDPGIDGRTECREFIPPP